jgi:hypothetical protein
MPIHSRRKVGSAIDNNRGSAIITSRSRSRVRNLERAPPCL